MDAQELWDPEKVLTIWVKNLNIIVHKMKNRISLLIDMKLKDADNDVCHIDRYTHIFR